MGFGINLKRILKEKGLTIKELAEISGVSVNTLYSITKRDTEVPTPEIIDKIVNALKINRTDLLTFEDLNQSIKNDLISLKQAETSLRSKLFSIAEMLNSAALAELLKNAIDMLQDEDDLYRSIFYKNDKF